jgi:hypothetical protein
MVGADVVELFAGKHARHKGFAFCGVIASPPEMASDQVIRMGFKNLR